MSKYKLIAMAFDGDYQTCRDRFHDTFTSINDAWEFANNLGSTWFFYPFYFVVSESGKTIADSPVGLGHLTGRRVETVVKHFAAIAKTPEAQGADVDTFTNLV